MKSRTLFLALLSTIAVSICASVPARAQRARVFVSVNGNDSNPCTALSPCRTFQAAHDAVQAGGEIDVLDTGGYGTLNITKSISIVNPGGVVASIATASGQSAIAINAGPTDTISLRGLTLDGVGIGGAGIAFSRGGSLEIADCIVRGYSNGIFFVASSVSALKVTNSEFNDNNDDGINVQPSASVLGTLDHVGFYNNLNGGLSISGLSASSGAINFSVKDSVASNNGNSFAGASFVSTSDVGKATTRLILTRTTVSNNPVYGVLSQGSGAQVIVDESTIFNNAHAWVARESGFIFTHGNNSVEDNAADFGPQTQAAALE
jgi:hypothetical protein